MNSWFFRFDTFSQRLCGTVLNSAWQCAPNWSFVGLKDKVYSQIGKVNRRSIVLPEKGARIVALPSSDAKIRGFSRVSLLVVDEASRVPDGDIALVSTPFGKRGFFCQEFLIDAPVGRKLPNSTKFRVTLLRLERVDRAAFLHRTSRLALAALADRSIPDRQRIPFTEFNAFRPDKIS